MTFLPHAGPLLPLTAAGQIAHALGGKKVGSGWMAKCPAHPDKTPSLSINESADGKVLVHCHAGCSQDEVIAALRHAGLWQAADAAAVALRTQAKEREHAELVAAIAEADRESGRDDDYNEDDRAAVALAEEVLEQDPLAEAGIVNTDMVNARRLVQLFGDDMRYTPERGWLIWDGRQWCPDDTGKVMLFAKETARRIYDEIRDSRYQDILFKWARR